MGGTPSISDHGSPKAGTPETHDSSFSTSSHEPSSPSLKPYSPRSAPAEGTPLPSLEEALARLNVEEDQQGQMFAALRNIFQTAQDRERSIDLSHVGSDGLWTILQQADVSSQHDYRDLEALRAIRDVVDQMQWRDSQLLAAVAKILADASRDGKPRSVHLSYDAFLFMRLKVL